jgi:hypothetical protein
MSTEINDFLRKQIKKDDTSTFSWGDTGVNSRFLVPNSGVQWPMPNYQGIIDLLAEYTPGKG